MSEQRARERAETLARFDVSRETAARLDAFVAMLLERQARTNLIARSTEVQVWSRHVADSLQLLPLGRPAKRWADLGSGAGFPGLVLACAMAEVPAAQVHLIDSVNRKAAFLQEVVTALALPAQVHVERVEAVLPRLAASIEVVTARALAPLAKLLDYSEPALQAGAVGLFMKGRSVSEELAEAAKFWRIDYELAPSGTDLAGRIVVVRRAEHIVLPRKLR